MIRFTFWVLIIITFWIIIRIIFWVIIRIIYSWITFIIMSSLSLITLRKKVHFFGSLHKSKLSLSVRGFSSPKSVHNSILIHFTFPQYWRVAAKCAFATKWASKFKYCKFALNWNKIKMFWLFSLEIWDRILWTTVCS